jgi:hypothetical protein
MRNERRELRNDLRGSEDERRAKQRDRRDGDHQRARRPHRAADDLGSKVGQPGTVLVASPTVFEGGDEDPLVKVRHRTRRAERSQQAQDPGAPADLRRTGGATLDMGCQPRGVCRLQLIEQERVDQVAGTRAVQGVVAVRVRHNLYMTGGGEKVARA